MKEAPALNSSTPDTSWWTRLVEVNASNPELKNALLQLNIIREKNGLTAEIEGVRRKVDFSSMGFTTVVAYEVGKDTRNTPILKYLTFPNLPWIEITRSGNPDKHGWTIEEE